MPTDHIHMVIRAEPKDSPAAIMQKIKSISASEFFRLHPAIKKKCFLDGGLWTQSYLVESIGNANESVIRQYIKSQLDAMNKAEENSRQLGLY